MSTKSFVVKKSNDADDVLQSRDQQRAKHALYKVQKLVDDKQDGQKFKSAVSGLPAMIHSNGLGHAFAFYLSDPSKFPERKKITEIVFDWLKESGVYGDDVKNDKDDRFNALNAVTQSDLKTHLIAQQEAQAYILWLKKFVRALFAEPTKTTGE